MIYQIRHGLCLRHLPRRAGAWGGNARDNLLFINAVFWILRTSTPWRDLPPDYGRWSNTHRCFIRWRDKGIWEGLLEKMVQHTDFEWLMIDVTHCKVHSPEQLLQKEPLLFAAKPLIKSMAFVQSATVPSVIMALTGKPCASTAK